MQMIVGFYRFIIAAFFVIAVGALAYMITMGISQNSGLGFLSIAGGLTMFFVVVIAIGATATFISIHDRLCELVDLLSDRLPADRNVDA